MATLTVGAGSAFEFNTLSSAVAASQDGDVILVQAGTYTNDFATITTNITIAGVGGMVNLVATEPPPNLKAILTIDSDVTLDNIELSGAAVSEADGGNGAGIRYESGNLVLDHCYIHDNQEGLLADADPTGTISINDSEFAFNGNASGPESGLTHNLYVGDIQQLTVTNSYFHDAVGGHEIKSRAQNTTIENSRIEDGPNGDGNYEIDLPNGGNAIIENNVIEKGPLAENSNFIPFGEEGGVYASSSLSVTGNTIINDDTAHPAVVVLNDTTIPVSVTNNTIYGVTANNVVSGPAATPENNVLLARSGEPQLDTSDPFLPVLPFSFPCFAAGTRILTAEGSVPVEALRVGQQVVVGQRQTSGESAVPERSFCPIKWIGHRYIDLTRHPDPRLAQPIRISQDAFADNVPQRDLLVSPDHAIYLDGLLIPARMLQNDATILREQHLAAVLYYHIELDHHDVVLAEGLPAESYLDTGNRGTFENADMPLILHPDFSADADGQARRVALSCAPFAADAARVEPIWRRLANRASQLGHVLREPITTTDPALHIVAADRVCLPIATAGGHYTFVLPRSADTVRLVSRATAPCDVTPWREDRRQLGVAVGRIIVTDPFGPSMIAIDHPSLNDGWSIVEREQSKLWRWTNGNASLPLPPGATLLQITLGGETIYRIDEETNQATLPKHALQA